MYRSSSLLFRKLLQNCFRAAKKGAECEIKQIEAKVVNRLRQVTAAILQDGTNQVNIITSTAECQAAIEFAKANAIHPEIVGAALKQICTDPEVAQALFEILQIDRIAKGKGKVTVMPPRSELLAALVAARQGE